MTIVNGPGGLGKPGGVGGNRFDYKNGISSLLNGLIQSNRCLYVFEDKRSVSGGQIATQGFRGFLSSFKLIGNDSFFALDLNIRLEGTPTTSLLAHQEEGITQFASTTAITQLLRTVYPGLSEVSVIDSGKINIRI